jgi:serine phosphatase RsbU (regulator of sigma subunit)
MARSLENARAYRDRDHVARTLQNSLLPPTLPQVPNLEIAALFRPALSVYEIGGDFYDVFQTPEGRWAAVIGDVCGKGIEAAALTSLARYTLRAAFRTDSPSDVLRALNEALLHQQLDGKFCTVCIALVDPGPSGSDVIVSSAGHPLPQLVRPDGSTRSVGDHGTLLGVTEDVRLTDVRARLAPGDTLVLYTDGLLARSRQHLDEADQLREVFQLESDGRAGDTVKQRVERYVDELTGDQQDDDVAVLLLTARSGV